MMTKYMRSFLGYFCNYISEYCFVNTAHYSENIEVSFS